MESCNLVEFVSQARKISSKFLCNSQFRDLMRWVSTRLASIRRVSMLKRIALIPAASLLSLLTIGSFGSAIAADVNVAANEAVSISQPNASTWTGLGFVESFSEAPVVIPSVLTSNDADPAEVMLSDVTASGVDVQSGEWEYQDGAHGDESIGLLLLPPGVHDLGGLSAEAGKASVRGGLARVNFANGFGSVPVVLAQLISEKGDVTATVRVRDVDANGFRAQLQTEEALGTTGDVRELHYVAIEEGSGSYNGQRLLVGKTGRVVRHVVREVEFGEELVAPLFYAQDQQRYGGDTAWVRLSTLSSDRAEIWIQEEQSANTEVAHTTENVGWVVIGDPVVVEPPNNPPQAVNDAVTITTGSTTVIDVLSNDIDIDGALLPNSLEIVDFPSHGTATMQPDGTILYTNNGLALFVDSFSYRVTDSAGSLSNTATVTVDVLPIPNGIPIANNDSADVFQGMSASVDVLINDTDPEGAINIASLVIVQSPAHGNASIQTDGSILYVHDGGEANSDSFTYTVDDADGVTSNEASVELSIEPLPNVGPVASDDSATVLQGGEVTIAVLGNDSDPDGDLLMLSIVAEPAAGSLALNEDDGTFTYTHSGDGVGTDSFTYQVTDPSGAADAATVIVTVEAAPVVTNPDTAIVASDNDSREVPIDVLANDSGITDHAIELIEELAPSLGTAVIVDNEIVYTASEASVGIDTFSYRVVGESGSAESTVVVTIEARPITLVDDVFVVSAEAGSVVLDLLANDSGPLDIASLVIGVLEFGSIETDVDTGELTYFAADGMSGEETFSYTVQDLTGTLEATANVTVTVEATSVVANPDTAIVASDNESRAVQINVLGNDTGITDHVVELVAESTPSLGVAVINDNVITYTAHQSSVGAETFGYRVQSENGSTESTVEITIEALPITLTDDSYAIGAGESSVVLDLLANDIGPVDSDSLEIGTVELGSVEPDPDTGDLIYYAAEGVSGEVTFDYTVDDVTGSLRETASVTVTIETALVAVVANNDDAQVDANQLERSVVIDVLGNDEGIGDPSGVTLQVIAGPTMGAVSVDENLVTYTFNQGVLGTDTFDYSITDASGTYEETATVTVSILPGSVIHSHHEMVPNPVHGSAFSVALDCKGAVSPCNWDQSSTWLSGTIPDSQSLVIVDGNVQIRFQDAIAKSIGVYPGGTLSFAPDSNTSLEVADILVVEGGALEIGSSESPIGRDRSVELVFRDLPFDAFDSKQHLRGLVAMGGSVRIHGHSLSETFIRSADELAVNENQINLAESAIDAGWRVGDSVVIPKSRQCAVASEECNDETEDRTISAISADGQVLTLNSGLDFNHPGARDHAGALDFAPHIINKSRNVVIRSENPQGTRGHLLFHGRVDVDIRYAEILSLGRTDINVLGPNNQKGRYPVHAHHLIGPATAQANGYQFTLVGNTVDFGEANSAQNRKWGISIHGSHYGLIEQNIVDHASGAAIVTESGEEIGNMFSKNFVVRVIGGNGVRTSDQDPGDNSKLGRSGSGYWFNGGGRNFFQDNVVAAIAECVYCYGFKFDNVRNGQLLFPLQQGDVPHMEGEHIAAEAVGLNNFVDNEAYAVPNGMTVWWECTFSDFPDDSCSSQIDSFKVWHHHRWGYHGYPENNMTLNGVVVRGDPSILVNRFENVAGLYFGDYMSRNVLIRNADIQNVRTAINMPTMRHERGAVGPDVGHTTVEDSYLVASSGIVVWAPASVNGASDLPPQTSVIRNVQFDYPDGHVSRNPPSHIFMTDASEFLIPTRQIIRCAMMCMFTTTTVRRVLTAITSISCPDIRVWRVAMIILVSAVRS